MARWVCLVFLLPLYAFAQVDVPLSTPESFIFPKDERTWEETHAPTVPSSTQNSITEPYATTIPPSQSTSSTMTPSTTQATESTTPYSTPQPTSSTAAPSTPEPTSSTAAPSTPEPTNSTAAPSTPEPTNSTAAPSTPEPTNSTAAPSTPEPTNSTTATTPSPTTSPVPKVGDYFVRPEGNSSACLMARMGLQFSFRMGERFQTVNLDPNVTVTSGNCGNNGSDAALVLSSDKITVHFTFTNQTGKFFMSAFTMTAVDGSGSNFTDGSTNLSLWEASLGSSYMCKKEQSFNITGALIMSTFELQVQPFGVNNDQFSTAHECSMDDASLLIPIIVGAALAVLILIVVIAYVIGRRKTYVGYQTL